jgi:UMF1 family MFS transporter
MTDTALRKRVWGWMAFDWASQPFYTLGLTFIFGPYLVGVISDTMMADGATEIAADASAQTMWANTQLIAGLVIAFFAPVLGAYADSTGRRMPWIVLFSIIYVLGSGALWYMAPDGTGLWFSLAAFILAFIAAEFALQFVNAQLPSLGPTEEVGKISGTGLAIGYWGGVAALFIMLLFFFESNDAGQTILGNAPAFGLDPEAKEGTRIVGPLIAGWFAVFMIPYFLWVREPVPVVKKGGIKLALGELGQSLKAVPKRRSLAAYLLSSMFYRDALNASYAFGGTYAKLVLNWELTFIAIFGIIGAVTAAIATFIGGIFDKRFGPKPVIIFCIVVLMLVCTIIVGMSRNAIFGVPLPEGSTLPDTMFFICGACIGGAGGALYSASRSMMVRHTNPDRPTEAFGLFALSGKATAFMAPALISLVTYMSGSARIGFAPVIFLFLIGLVLLLWVHPRGDSDQWSDG